MSSLAAVLFAFGSTESAGGRLSFLSLSVGPFVLAPDGRAVGALQEKIARSDHGFQDGIDPHEGREGGAKL